MESLQLSITFNVAQSRLNRENLRDLIAAIGLVISPKLDSNHRFFSLCDLEIWWMTSENNRTPLLYYIKLCASNPLVNSNLSYSPDTLNSGQNQRFFCPVWTRNLTHDLEKQRSASSMVPQAKCIISYPLMNSKWGYSPETPNMGQNHVWPWNLTDDLEKQ